MFDILIISEIVCMEKVGAKATAGWRKLRAHLPIKQINVFLFFSYFPALGTGRFLQYVSISLPTKQLYRGWK